MQAYADLGDFEEDERIAMIVNATKTMKPDGRNAIICFVVEDSAKADRYIEKMKKIEPGIRVTGRFPGPTPSFYTVKVEYDGSMTQ